VTGHDGFAGGKQHAEFQCHVITSVISALPGQRAFPTDLPARPAGPENLLARYAAGEVAPGAERGRAMRLIVWGSTIGSVAGRT
jgi:hypothetical protein